MHVIKEEHVSLQSPKREFNFIAYITKLFLKTLRCIIDLCFALIFESCMHVLNTSLYIQ